MIQIGDDDFITRVPSLSERARKVISNLSPAAPVDDPLWVGVDQIGYRLPEILHNLVGVPLGGGDDISVGNGQGDRLCYGKTNLRGNLTPPRSIKESQPRV